MQGIEYQEALFLHDGIRKQVRSGEKDKFRIIPVRIRESHGGVKMFGLVGPHAFVIIIEVIFVDAGIDPVAPEDPVVPADDLQQVPQVGSVKEILSHLVLLDIETLQETGLLKIQIPDHAASRRIMAAAGFRTDQFKSEGEERAILLAVNDLHEDIHRIIVHALVVGMHGGKAGTGKLRTVQVVKAGDQHLAWNADAAFLKGGHQADRHFIIGADKGIGQGILFPQPHFPDIDPVGSTPGAADHFHVFLRDPIIPAGGHKAVQPLMPFGAFIIHDAGQVDQTAGPVFTDDVFSHGVLGFFIVKVNHGAARELTADGNGGDSGAGDRFFHILPRLAENDLVGLYEQPVELLQIRQAEDRVFAAVFFIAQVLAETVEDTNLDVRMVLRILLQPVESFLHELIVPVYGQERDAVQVFVCFHL